MTGLCVSVSLSTFLPVCLPACLPVCLPVCKEADAPPPQKRYTTTPPTTRFLAAHGRHPGSLSGSVEDDVPLLRAAAAGLLAEMGAPSTAIQEDAVVEMARCALLGCDCVCTCCAGLH